MMFSSALCQPELRLLVAGVRGGLLCHRRIWDVDSSVFDQSSDGPEPCGGLHKGDLQQHRQVRQPAGTFGGGFLRGLRLMLLCPVVRQLGFIGSGFPP